jgi:predicted nuclease with TOPRIM domain
MTDSMTNALILESLKAMQATLSEIADDLRDLKSDLRGVRGRKAVLKHGEVAQDNALTAIQTRLDRIERRLETSD